MTIHKYVGEDVDFEFPVKDSEDVPMDLSEAITQFIVRRMGVGEDDVNQIDRVPITTLSVVSDSLTPEETIVLGAGSYLWEIKVRVGNDVKKRQGKLVLHASYTD